MRVYFTAKQFKEVSSLQEASAACREFIESNGFGSSDLTARFGIIKDGSKTIATVSYNGRVWSPQPWAVGSQPIYDPI